MVGLKQIVFDVAKTFRGSTQVSYTSAGVITFQLVDNAVGGIDHIHDAAGQFIAQGFNAGDIVESTGSANDGILFNVVAVSTTTLEVASLGTMTAEVGVAGAITIETPLATSVYGFGAMGDHGALSGLTDDDHTQYIRHNLSTSGNDFLVGSGSNTFIKKTLAETKTILGVTSARAQMFTFFP
jgi:hypothetical protein